MAQDPAPAPAPPAPVPAPPALKDIRQVQMHVWISETTEQGMRDIGANLNYTRFSTNRGDTVQQITTNVFDPLNPLFNVTLPAPDQTNFDAPLRPDLSGSLTDGVQTQSGAGLNFTLFQNDSGRIDGLFRGIDENSDLDLISKPELLVIHGVQATIHAGGQVPYQDIKYDTKGNAQLNVKFEDIGVKLVVTPTILDKNMIQLNIAELKVTDITRVDNIRGVDLPVFATRSQTGVVLVPNSQALVIGGLSSTLTRQSERRVPLLGKIPILGIPFRGRKAEVRNTHLMIFVAPTIIDLRKMTPSATNALQFWQQGSWTNEETIASEIQSMEDEL
ncbi:MAG: hypothetical protein COA73_01285 [Candidatus Hydrogenedentota bacterium]|nr:MAG: hypothetical protein COA73_01285 [Candidatus Hydrogenedentota bacterium]